MRRIVAAIAALFLSTFALIGCGDTSTDSHGSHSAEMGVTAANAQAAEIVINGFEYSTPAPVMPGQTVTVRNNTDNQHSVTSDTPGLFDVIVNENEVVRLTAPDEPGSYAFHCTYFSDMHGTLTVED